MAIYSGLIVENGGLMMFNGMLFDFMELYPLVIEHNYGTSPCFSWENSLNMVLFKSHVELPDGIISWFIYVATIN